MTFNWMILLGVVEIAVGVWMIVYTVNAIIRTFMLPRGDNPHLTALIFRLSWVLFFQWRVRRELRYPQRDRIAAFFAPVTMLMLPVVWLTLILFSYMLIYHALGVRPLSEAFILSGSSLFTLGFADRDNLFIVALIFSEATFGLGLVALLIAFLPTLYTAFADREAVVAKLEVRAGNPPSAEEMLARAHRIEQLGRLEQSWSVYEDWFTRLEESHTSLGMLPFFRSPMPNRSWITAAGAILDAAALRASTLDLPRNPEAELCLRAGYIALNRIADFFQIDHPTDATKVTAISIARQEYDEVINRLAAQGLPIKRDRDQAWRDYFGWRVNYDVSLIALANLTLAPYAPWSSDRSVLQRRYYWRWDGKPQDTYQDDTPTGNRRSKRRARRG